MLLMVLQAPVLIKAAKDPGKEISGIAAYGMDGKLCTFMEIGDAYQASSLKATAYSEGEEAIGEAVPQKLKKCGATVRYLFIVDASGSMKEHEGEIRAFVRSLMNAEKQKAVYTVASFGEQFTVVAENQTDSNTVMNIVSGLKYEEKLTNPYTAIQNALIYLDSCPRKSGDLVNLVMISDGQPDLGIADPAKEKTSEKKMAADAVKKMNAAPETVVHTMVFHKNASPAFDPLRGNSGVNQTVKNPDSAKKAGKKLASFSDRLYYMAVPLPGGSAGGELPVRLQFQGNLTDGQFAMANVSWDTVPVLDGMPSGKKEEKKTENKKTEETEAGDPDGVDADDETDAGAVSPGAADQKKPGAAEPGDTKTTGHDSPGDSKLYWIIGGCGIALVLLILILLLRKRSHTARAGQKKEAEAVEGAICMKLEVISGQCRTSKCELYLGDQLTVGSTSDCDLIWKEDSVSKYHARLFRKGQVIYIEDTDSRNGTFLNGMRLHAPSKLRSGDEIRIGTAYFSLRF